MCRRFSIAQPIENIIDRQRKSPMLDTIQRFFNARIQPSSPAITSQEASDHALMLATAALLIEVTRADRDVKPEEQAAVLQAIRTAFDLPQAEADELIALAEEEARQATSLYQFTYLIDKGFSITRKRHVVELMWRVVFSDAQMEKHEEALVRRVADLIHVPHRDFIDAKLRVKQAMQGPNA